MRPLKFGIQKKLSKCTFRHDYAFPLCLKVDISILGVGIDAFLYIKFAFGIQTS